MSPWRFGENIDMSENESFEEFAIRIYKHFGIENIEHLDKYSTRSIPISAINDDNDLSIIIQKELRDAEIEENGLSIVDSFEGGIVIDTNDDNSITHSCCGAISDYKNWVKFIKTKPINWVEIWIGHPWVYGRVRDGIVQLSDFRDETTEKVKDDDSAIKYAFDLLEFEAKLQKAKNEIHTFKNRIKVILESESNKYFNELPEILIENNSSYK